MLLRAIGSIPNQLSSKVETSKLDSRSVLTHHPTPMDTHFFLTAGCFFRVQALFLGEINNSAREVGQDILYKVGSVHRAGNGNVMLGNITWNSQRNGIGRETARSRQC